VEGWSNIIHVTATMGDCCEYGDRIPVRQASAGLSSFCLSGIMKRLF
jgi:hypothetical protein